VERILSRFSLKYQIACIGVIGVLGLSGFGAEYFVSDASQSRSQAVADASSAAFDRLRQIEIDLLQARRAEKDFLLRRTESYLTRHQQVIGGTLASFAELEKTLVGSDLAPQIAAASAGVKAYGAQFAKVGATQITLGLDETKGLLGTLRKSVQAAEESLKAHNELPLIVSMLMMRRHEKDFLARLDPKYGDDMKKRATEFEAQLANSAIPAADRKAITERMGAYHKDFQALLAGQMALVGEIKALSDGYAKVEPVLDAISKRIQADYDAAKAELGAKRAATSQMLVWSIAIVTLLVAIFAFVVSRGVSGPLLAIATVMARLAKGDNDVSVRGTTRGDEIGAMAMAVQVFKDNALAMAKLKAEQEELKAKAEREKKAAMNRLADAFDASVNKVVRAVSSSATEMQSSAQILTSTAEETSRQSTAVAAASDQASANVQTVATASEELSSSITEISRQVAQSATIAGRAVDEATRTNQSVQSLAEAAQKIGDVVKLINDIAGQTNLLALNATIEAARAGEAGKGFAVVASEVKSLATQTARATEDIASQVEAIQSATGLSVTAIESIGKTIAEINEIATAIASAVEEQGAATGEISRNVTQAAQGTQDVSANIAGVTQAAGETGQAASHVLAAAGELSQQSETLRGEVDRFLAEIRAA
jgi:methyl-accepting chemotaxis protein